MKAVANYIGGKFSYGSNIHGSLDIGIKTGVPSPTSLNGNGDNGELYIHQNFVSDKNMTEFIKHQLNLNKNCQKAYALIFG